MLKINPKHNDVCTMIISWFWEFFFTAKVDKAYRTDDKTNNVLGSQWHIKYIYKPKWNTVKPFCLQTISYKDKYRFGCNSA